MEALSLAPIDPWRLELIVVRTGSHNGSERSALARDVERALLIRLRMGVYVERAGYESLPEEDRHIVRMRALAAVSPGPVVFSHWSAAVAHGLPVLQRRLAVVHTTVAERRARGQEGVSAHLFGIASAEVVSIGGLLVTSLGRTVVDVASAAPFEEGLMAADAALHSGVPREVLEAAVDLAGPRRAGRRIGEVVSVAHPGAESAAESRSRATMMRIGVAPPRLQYAVRLRDGRIVYLDFHFPEVDVGGEVDGAKKFLDPRLAKQGAGRAVYEEKLREQEVRWHVSDVARWGWVQAGSTGLLRPLLARHGVLAAFPRATLADYAAAACGTGARFAPRRPPVQR